jgi:hypothetical protein
VVGIQLIPIHPSSVSGGRREEREDAIGPRSILTAVFALSPLIVLLAGGIAMCCLYRPGERLGPLGYWIVWTMLAASFLIVLAALLGRTPEMDDEVDADEPESEDRPPLA